MGEAVAEPSQWAAAEKGFSFLGLSAIAALQFIFSHLGKPGLGQMLQQQSQIKVVRKGFTHCNKTHVQRVWGGGEERL